MMLGLALGVFWGHVPTELDLDAKHLVSYLPHTLAPLPPPQVASLIYSPPAKYYCAISIKVK